MEAGRHATFADLQDGRRLTPMLRQYLDLRDEVPDAVMLFRMGDFYEAFFDDARTISEALDLTLTARDKYGELPIPMAGVPHHAVRSYVQRLVEQGHKVALVDQVEDPKQAKGIVRRAVAEVVTPGTVLDAESLDARAASYLLAVVRDGGDVGLACVDVSTGEFICTELPLGPALQTEIDRLAPREVLHVPGQWEGLGVELPDGVRRAEVPDHAFAPEAARRELIDLYGLSGLDGLGLGEAERPVRAAGAILHYLRASRLAALGHLRLLRPYSVGAFMVLDEATRRNLELFRTMAENKRHGSVIGLIDQAQTPMGSRRLRSWLSAPLLSAAEVKGRADAVSGLHGDAPALEQLRLALSLVADLERLTGRLMSGRAHARDLLGLARSLRQVPPVDAAIDRPALRAISPFEVLDPLADVLADLDRWLAEDPPLSLRDGDLIRPGADPRLDELADLGREGKGALARLEAEERSRTGITNLKIKYTSVFGYYLEVTRSQLHLVPPHYIRKQTVANAERFFTPELKAFEDKVLHAEDRRKALEYELFVALRERVAMRGVALLALAERLATLDALQSLAWLARAGDWVRPEVDESEILHIEAGRHPVLDRLRLGERFVPNDTNLDAANQRLLVITGPNMAGKSTVMRQVALITLLAQIGSFVPARSARIGVVDRIFTRVGASDNLARGQSTFMVEMAETAAILQHATGRSLAILDEIGRGTSTWDGLAIAWAVAEYLADRVRCRALFATHYHELCELADGRPAVRNFNIAVSEMGGRVIFLRRLLEGAASRSYGIQVARLAGLPDDVIRRAREVLAGLEGEGGGRLERSRQAKKPQVQLSLFAPKVSLVEEELRRIEVEHMTPLEALSRIAAWKAALGSPR